jgi:hypothetical protein
MVHLNIPKCSPERCSSLSAATLMLFIFALISVAAPPALAVNGVILDQQVDAEGKGYTVLHVWGTHREMGYAHGYLLADEIVAEHNQVVSLLGSGYENMRQAMAAATWLPDVIEDELDGMVAALAELHPGENIDKLDLKVINGYGDWSYPPACRSHSCWGDFVDEPVKTLSTRRLDFGSPFPSINHHVLCAWEPDDGSLSWLGLSWPGYVVGITTLNEFGTQVSVHDYDTGGTPQSDALLRTAAARYMTTMPEPSSFIQEHLYDCWTELAGIYTWTGAFVNLFVPEGHGGVFACSRASGFYDVRTPQGTYFGGDVLVTANAWTDGTYTPSGAEFMADYYAKGGIKDLEGHWSLMGASGLHKMSVAYRGRENMTVWVQGRLDPGITPRLEYEWSQLFGINDGPAVVVGAGPAHDNPTKVRLFIPSQDPVHVVEFNAYYTPHFGANVATGDVIDDDDLEIVTGAGPGAVFGPHVRTFYAHGYPVPHIGFLAYGTNKWGVNVTTGNIDSDGWDEIITGPGPGAVFGPHVRAFHVDGGTGAFPVDGVNFFAYGTHKWGVNVAAGDIDGDGRDEIVTGAGPGAVFGPHVRGWDCFPGGTPPRTDPIPGVSFMAYGTNKWGVEVTCGDVDGDGMDEIVTGPGSGSVFGAHVRGWNYDGVEVAAMPGLSFFAWPPEQARYGAEVFAGADLSGDGRNEIVVGGGPDPNLGSPVKVFRYNGQAAELWLDFEAFPAEYTHGTKVAAGRF